MGVLNATPDSFYSASRIDLSHQTPPLDPEILEGADFLDVGGESTRPGSTPVDAETETARVVPLLKTLRQTHPAIALSIDTQKAAVARAALEAGAVCVNDVSAMRADPAMADVVASSGAGIILMHMKGTPATMQTSPIYEDVVGEILAFFEERLRAAELAGIRREKIILDPGIGFGKTLAHNQQILHNVKRFAELGYPVLIATSRKQWIGQVLADASGHSLPPEARLEGSLAAALWAVSQGARGLRVHDTRATRRALTVWNHLKQTSGT